MSMSDDDTPQTVLIVRSFRIGASEEDLSNVVVRLSSSLVGPTTTSCLTRRCWTGSPAPFAMLRRTSESELAE
jgi:hypothetical protein